MNGNPARDFQVKQTGKTEKWISEFDQVGDSAAHFDLPAPLFSSNENSVAETKNRYQKKTINNIVGPNSTTKMQYFPIMEPELEDGDVTAGDTLGAYLRGVIVGYRKDLIQKSSKVLGYPMNMGMNDYGDLFSLLEFTINNIGDPFVEGNFGVHSRPFELGVLDWFARLWGIENDEYWGYVTNGGTEGNMHGILVGRELFPDGILYASKDSHYSVFKAAHMYRMECVEINSLISGEIDCDDFGARLLKNKDKPAIVNVNIGTTVKGAMDDIDAVIRSLEENGFNHNRFYIHCDGALFGIMMPFIKQLTFKLSFKKPIGSISVSGHKFLGCPLSCGVLITRLEHINGLSKNVEYLSTKDATISGSRSGQASIFLWYTLNLKGYKGLHEEVNKCLKTAQDLIDGFHSAGISAMLNPFSNTVVFERPRDDNFSLRWQLACQGKIAHVVVMPCVNIEKLHDFLDELIHKRQEWWFQDGKMQSPCIADVIGYKNCMCALHI